LLIVVLALLGAVPAPARTVKVDNDQLLASALAGLKAGDTLKFAAGRFEVESGIKISKPNVVLLGAGADQSILDGAGEAYAVVTADAKNVTIDGFTIRGGASHGVYVNGTNSAVIRNNVITGNDDRGILLGMGTPWATITGNTIVNNKVSAIYSYRDEARTSLGRNIIAGNSRGLVTDYDSGNINLRNNCFWGQSNDNTWASKHKSNLVADPLFIDADSDWHLRTGSPCLPTSSRERIGALGTGTNPPAPKSQPKPQPASNSDLADYRIVIFANDEDVGELILDLLAAEGFTNDDNYVTDEPNDEPNVKYGSAPASVIEQLVEVVGTIYDGDLELMDEFASDDDDIFINLP
jgi:hypothetical protein